MTREGTRMKYYFMLNDGGRNKYLQHACEIMGRQIFASIQSRHTRNGKLGILQHAVILYIYGLVLHDKNENVHVKLLKEITSNNDPTKVEIEWFTL